jgi:hypothetical protein
MGALTEDVGKPSFTPNTAVSSMSYTEIKSHSSLLSNERLAILFYMLDLNSMNLNTYYNENYLMRAKANLYQIYKNIRPILRTNLQVRQQLNLETKDPGVYIPDLYFGIVNQMIQYCTFHGFTYKKCYAIASQLNDLEILIRDILQFFNYFFRHDFKQKPDVFIATEKYKKMADSLTLEKLRNTAGKNNKIDFSNLGIGYTNDDDYSQKDSEIEDDDIMLDDEVETEPDD